MVQDIYPHKLYNQYDKEAVATAKDTVLNIYDGKILLYKSSFEKKELVFPKVEDFKNDSGKDSEEDLGKKLVVASEKNQEKDLEEALELRYLFSIDQQKYFLLEGQQEQSKLPKDTEYIAERDIRIEGIGPAEELFAAITGKHLADWYRDAKYCGRCGHKMHHSTSERAMKCESCGNRVYPRIMPAVIVGVINGDKLLLTRYKVGYAHNALIAGFTEIGETMEETVQREVMEEAGLRVKNIRYYKSQPWGSANDILLGYYCEVDGDDTIVMDQQELKYAEWVRREDIVLQPGTFSLTNEMMMRFKDGSITAD